MTAFVVLVVLEALNARASIQLRSQQFIRLHKSVQLRSQISILTLENPGVAFQGLSLIKAVILHAQILTLHRFLAINVSPGRIEMLLKCLQISIRVPILQR